ncbi:MAG: HD-GYP domain-containing protein [Phycisphaerales bacterium]|nr:HD-GYP domain-containing protein [Planctomycetota bacterium]MCH8509416.1 HD-GYP domain-containing protein [Phycisphaerales bacterium]
MSNSPNHQASEAGCRLMAEYFPVAIDVLNSSELELDLYLVHGGGKPVLYRSTGSAYSVSDCALLAERGITHLYVPITQHRGFQALVSKQLTEAYEDPALGRAERCRIVRGSCGKMIEDFMADPTLPGLGGTIASMADRFSAWCTEDETKFGYLLDMSEHDFYTISHMVNVGVGCGLLGAELLGTEHAMVRDLVLGGLVHDVGKRGVPAEVLNKEGKLTDAEWALIRAHPQTGAEILSGQEQPEPLAVEMALSHHERLDGKGYPRGLVEAKIGLPARICAVVDVYDAMTTARPYRGPIAPRKVLAKMREEIGTAFDGEVFGAWERVVERMLEADPERAVPDDPGAEVPALSEIMPVPESVPAGTDAPTGRTVVVRRADGSGLAGELVERTFEGMTLNVAARFRAGERVHLLEPGHKPWVATFRSTRINCDGVPLSVFKFSEAKAA